MPFPFSERPGAKRRPALIISRTPFNEHGHSMLAMITTRGHRPWLGDTDIEDREAARLELPCTVRLKLFTLDNRLILSKIGRLADGDQARVGDQIRLHAC